MADRFWVGGTGTWNTTSTTNWSATSGGPNGASVPTVADSVFFDQAGTYTVTMTGGLTCLDITVSAGTVTFATGTTPSIDIRGSMSLVTGTVWSNTGPITFSSTTTGRTITTNGTVLTGAFSGGAVTFNGAGGGWTLGSALTVGGAASTPIAVTQGTLNTAGFNITTPGSFSSTGALTRALVLGASTISVGSGISGAPWNVTSTGLTLNAGTSTIVVNGSNTFAGAGFTYNNLTFAGTGTGTRNVTSANTFNNFAVTGPASAGVSIVTFDSQQTINGTLSTTGTAGNRRVFFASATYGTSVDLVVNSAPSLTDADFRGLYVHGTAAPISGTRIGNRGECRGITFSTPKTVFWNFAGVNNWDANGWCASSGGTPNTNNFPLPQDTATFTNAGGISTISLNSFMPNVDFSSRTDAVIINTGVQANFCYGNWTNGPGVTFSGTQAILFSGGTTQTITSAGKTFTCPITIDTYGGTVQLADALNIGSNTLTVTNGTFTTAGYAVTLGTLASSNSNVRTINLGSSTVTATVGTVVNFGTSTNLTLNAGTSSIVCNSASGITFGQGGAFTFNNVSITAATSISFSSSGSPTFNNLSITAPASAGILSVSFAANQTINGTLTCAGASAVRRIFLRSDTIGTPRTLTVNAISATDCDFRDINLAGAASGASPTRAGDCGGNTGITFPAPKTVYWNLAGAQNWSATAWATGSGGTPAVNNFPLPQDTAVFDNTGSAGTVTINAVWDIGTFDASLRTSAMTLNPATGGGANIYGDWKFGTGVTCGSTANPITFSSGTTETITSNGVQFGCPIIIDHPNANVQLADALSLGTTRTLTLTAGTFDAVTYNVTTGLFANSTSTSTLRMGSGTWTLSGVGTVWDCNTTPTCISGTSTIVLSDTSTTARTFNGGSLYYNKLTIGGTTGTSTLTITGGNRFGELASTKTVAHTIAFGANANTFGKWSITGTAGNVVTITGTSASNFIAGPAVTGVDYLAMGSWGVINTSAGEFYAGANSTGTAAAPVFRTAAPAPRTLYWVGGTGNWSSTTKWDTTSGGGGGAAIPTSLDAVNFNSASNATAYTATIDAGVTLARCASFTMAGPASGNVTFAGTVGIAFHGNVSFAATGITRSYTGPMGCAGNSSYTFTPNGLVFGSSFSTNGIGATWTLGSALNIQTSFLLVNYGSFSTSGSNYAITAATLSSSNPNIRSINLNGSTLTLSGNPITFTISTNLTFNAGTSTILASAAAPSFFGGGQTFNNASFTNTGGSSATVSGQNTFNNFTVVSQSVLGIYAFTFSANQTISTLTLNAGTASAYRTFLASDTIGTTRTLTVGTLTAGAADIDFRDIAITGAAAPISGTRFGDAKGNSGITFPAAKTVYWALTGGVNWGGAVAGSWSATNGGSAAANQFPLAQDTAFIPFARPTNNQTITVNANYNIGTIDMNERNGSALVALSTGTTTPQIYGNWINGTGTTLLGTGRMTFAGRGSQTITSAGIAFTQSFTVNTPGGSVALLDALNCIAAGAGAVTLTAGTFNANSYNFTLSDSSGTFASSNSNTRTVEVGSGTWTIVASGTAWNAATSAGLTVTGTGTISLTSAGAKTFAGGGANYSNVTLDHNGAGALTITGNNTFKTIAKSYFGGVPVTLSLAATTQTLTSPWTASGAVGEVLTVNGTSAASPATLIFTGVGQAAAVDYLAINNVRAYNLTDTWYAGLNSTNGGSLGWYFVAGGGTVYFVTVEEAGTGTDSVFSGRQYTGAVVENSTATDAAFPNLLFLGAISESATGQDVLRSHARFASIISETATGADAVSALKVLTALIAETATGTELIGALAVFKGLIAEGASVSDALQAAGSTYNTLIAESATQTDRAVAQATFPTAVTEAATGTEINSAAFTPLVRIIETATVTDVTSALAAFAARTAESANITDAVSPPGSIYNPVVLAVATMLDSVNAPGSIYNPRVVESATIADSLIGGFLWNLIDNADNANWTLITPVSTLEVVSAWSSSATNGVTAVSLNGFYTAGAVTTYAVSTQNGPWLYRSINGQNLSTVTYVNGSFYAYSPLTSSPNQLYRSTDGFNWTQLQAPNPARPVRAIFGNGTQLIVQQNSTQIYLSNDNGATWATNTITFAASTVTAAVWDGTKYVYNNGRRIYTSTDGATWTLRYTSNVLSQRSSLVWNGTYFVAVFQGANSNLGSGIARSTNGTTWTTMYSIGWMAIVFNFGNTFAVALRDGEFYSIDPATNNYAALGTNTGYIYEAFASGDFGVSFYNGEYILPAYNLTAINQLPASPNLVTFTPEQVSLWSGIDDSQTPNWQNTNTLN